MGNVAVEVPGATTTVAATVAFELDEANVIVVPEDGANPFRVTFPIGVLPPATTLGVIESPTKAAGFTVRLVVRVVPERLAEIVTVIVLA